MARIAIGRTPLIGLRLPSRESSPIITYLSSMVLLICSDAAKIAMAMGKSYDEPSFLMSAGAMLIVIFFLGYLKLLLHNAASILC